MPHSDVLIAAHEDGGAALPLLLLGLFPLVCVCGPAPSCGPCPGPCTCPRAAAHCAVNCSDAGLVRSPRAAELPHNTAVLDLSYNSISSLDDNLFNNLTSLQKIYLQGNNISILLKEIFAGRRYLSVIDISNNQISTLEDGIFADLFNLSEINLSFNDFVCDCNLSWLPAWINSEEAKGVNVVDSEFIKCAKPSKFEDLSVFSVNISRILCGSEYMACLSDKKSIVSLSLLTLWNSSRENCTALCFAEDELYAALDSDNQCLCGSSLEPDSIALCTQEKTGGQLSPACGCTVVKEAFQVTIANFAELRTFSLYELARLTVVPLVHVSTFQWDFGDLSPLFNTTDHVVLHKYSLPGTYLVSVTLFVGHRVISLHVEIQVTVHPGRMELTCPPVVQTQESIGIGICNWDSLNVTALWSITTPNGNTTREMPSCSLGGYLTNSRCYKLVNKSSTWSKARHFCQSHTGGDLAILKDLEVQTFLLNVTECRRPVWIGLSDTVSAGTLQWVDGSILEHYHNWLPGEPNMLLNNTCVLMGVNHAGQWRAGLCNTKRRFICEYRPGEKVLDADYFLLGPPAFSTHQLVKNLTINRDIPTLVGQIELMVFPGLWFGHKGFVSALEFATQSLNSTVQIRFQIYRPRCVGTDLRLVTPGNEETCTPFAFCTSQGNSNFTTGCPRGTFWCNTVETCLPLREPCGDEDLNLCPNLILPQFNISRLSYDRVKEVTCTVPADRPTHYVVLLRNESIPVQSNDIIAIQHDGEPGSFLQCQQDPSSPWQKRYFSIITLNGTRDVLRDLTDVSWSDSTVCNLRVLYTRRQETIAKSPLIQNAPHSPGLYTYQSTMENVFFPTNLSSCTIKVVAPIRFLRVIHPKEQNGVYFVPRNQTVIIVQINSWGRSVTCWAGSNQTFPCQAACPLELSSDTYKCERVTNDTCFSRFPITFTNCTQMTIVISAKNEVSSINKTVTVKSEELIQGLRVMPDPKLRVLSNTLVSYTAVVTAGTDITFKWNIDDNPSFTNYKQVFNVIYCNEAVYKLSLTASNHVNGDVVTYNVTVYKRNPLADLCVSGIPAIAVRDSPCTFTGSVTVDAAVNATFRWSYGDGSPDKIFDFRSPYNHSDMVQLLSDEQVVLQQNATHTYQSPGDYNLTVTVSDKYENISRHLLVRVCNLLTNVTINMDSDVIAVDQRVQFEAVPWPATQGITYTWHFSDNLAPLNGTQQRVNHTFRQSGKYNVSVRAHNAISSVEAGRPVGVLEQVVQLSILASSPTELSSPTIVTASSERGTDISWTFDMGDGTPLVETRLAMVNHTYAAVGNYMLSVTATNPLGAVSASHLVHVFVLQVCRIEPSECVQELVEVSFRAFTPGDPAKFVFSWDFGDGSPNVTVPGDPTAKHNYTRSSPFLLTLSVSSSVNKVNFYSNMCVQSAISLVVLTPLSRYVKLGEESVFRADVFPESQQYTYVWDLEGMEAQQAHGREMNVTFRTPGLHTVNVTVFNNVSSGRNTSSVEIQAPVRLVRIKLREATFATDLVLGRTYAFTAQSEGDRAEYGWDFGDGRRESGVNASHSYCAPGRFVVVLTVRNMVSSEEATLTITVKTPIAGLRVTANTSTTPVNMPVGFVANHTAGDHVNYLWSFCNSCSLLSEPATVFYTFISPGLFNVSVTAKNGISTGQASILVFVLKEIKGLKMILPNLVEDCCFATEQTLQMQLVIREGTNVSYKWTVLSEGVTVFQCMENDTKACFSEPGTYHIVLQASNLLGSLSVNRSVLVMERVDGVELRAEPEPVAVGTTANISASLHAGTNVTYVWSLGGNFTIPTLRPFVRHRFQSPGLKHINVTVTNKLGSSSGTLAIRVQEPVTGLTINTGDPSSQCYVATNTTLILRGSVHSGTNISWIWMLWNTEERTQQEITLSFASAGVYEVSLNASNDVSCDMAVKRLIVQDTVRGLQLEASKWTVAPREELIFTVRYSSGTDLILSLSFGNSLPVLLNNTSYSYSFRELGPHTVRLRAENRVSSIETSLVIQVIEPIAGLRLRDQNVQAIPAGVLRTFGAVLSKGSQVSYTWDFELGGLNKTLHGQNVSYTPKAQGQLKVFLSAFNNISRENVSIVILVQEKILSTRLTVIPLIAVVKETVYLNLSRTPSSSQASFEWKFGDGSQDAFTKESVKTHLYSRPGEYEVEVNASNSVSFLIAKVKVIVVLLKCDPPKIHLVLSDTMKSAERNYLEAEIDLKGCAEYQIEYLWDIYKALRCETFQQVNKVELGNVDLTRPQLLLPRQALQIGNYCVNFSISFSGTSYSKSTFSVVTLIPSPLVPIIDGGTARSWSPTQDLILDGTESYDLDQPIESQTPLNYNWFCICSWKEPSKCNISGNGAVFYIPSHRLEDTKYTCHLTVSKPNREPQSVEQIISMKNGTSPLVSLECISCKAQSVHGVSRSSHIILSGSCSNCHWSSQYAWEAETFNKIPLVLNSTTTTTGSTEMNLVVRHRVLQDGVGYTFSLNVIDPLMENVGFASIYIPPMYPPSSGNCQIYPTENISALTTSVTFTCTGWKDTNDTGAPLVYSFILTRCKSGGNQCNEFYVYRGSRSEYSAVLPPGFRSNHFIAYIAVIVETQQGAAAVAINKSVVINITDTPEGFQTLTDWMKLETETKLQDLLKQGDPQPTIEYALALITVLNEQYERIRNSETELRKPETEWGDDAGTRIDIRSNITLALTSLKVTTVDDTQQISAALAQCTVISREFICRECQKQTLFAVDNMISVLQKETGQGKMTPTSIADNILVTAGGLIDITNQQVPCTTNKSSDNSTCSPELMATEAYNLSVKLMQVLMDTRVLNEEPLSVRGNKMVADGKRADRYNLLCFDKNSSCQFSIPHSFSRVFTNISDVTQVLFLVDSNPFPYGYIENYTVSSKVASIEFRTDNGTHIPIENLNLDRAVTVKVSTRVGVRNTTVNTTVINGRSSVTVNITSGNLNKEAGLHIQVTYTLLNETLSLREANSFIHVLLHNSTNPNESNFKTKKRIDLESVRGSDHKLYTFFLSPDVDDTTKEYYLNITNYYSSSVRAAVGVYTSLCQYFNTTTMSWQTDGIVPLEDTTPDTATCLTQHLTAFGASLFVPPNSVVFINPPTSTVVRNYVVLITCSVCFVIYAVSAFIVRKLDQIDIKWVGFIPFCGIDGYYKYEILVKTGWGRGSGTTSHVGISLYGKETKSGHRHLDNQSAFRRNGLDVFQIATGYSLGRVWKIRVWHDNRGLSPSWYLQHVIIKDLQTNESYYFLVNDWLSVDNDRNRGLVEKEVLMATEAELKDFGRIFIAEIQQGLSEKHIWLSVWDRHPRSRFTRVQRVTCCLVLIYLVFCAGAVWYGIIRDINNSDVPIATQVPLSGESMAAGVVSSVIVYPVYLFVVMLYRMSRSQASIDEPVHMESHTLEIDDFIESSTPGSSFLTFAETVDEDYRDKLKSDISSGATLKSLSGWQAYDGVMNWPDLLNDRSIMGSSIPKLKRGRATRHLGIETPLCSEEEPSSFGFDPVKNICFSTSDEQLIERILTDGSNAVFASHTIGQASLVPESQLISNLKTEILSGRVQPRVDAAVLHKISDCDQVVRPSRDSPKSAVSRRTAFSEPPKKCLFPSWCSYTAHVLSFFLFSGCISVSVWIGINFTASVSLMWLISGIFSILCSFFLLEPLKVLTEALYFAMIAKRVHPDEDDNLVERPRVELIAEKIGRVRPPQGYGLLQAKEEAKKVHTLHKMLKNFIIYMLFLLVVLLINYGDSFKDGQSRLLHSSIRQGFAGVRKSVEFQRIKRSGELWKWMAEVLLPYLYSNKTGSLLGCPRLRQVRSKEVNCLHQASLSLGEAGCQQSLTMVDTNNYEMSWKRAVVNRSTMWPYSEPDPAGVWYWGQIAVYDSGGYTQKLARTKEESSSFLWDLQKNNWLDGKTRAVFIEFTQFYPNVDLYAVGTLLIEFPVSGGVFTTFDVSRFPLLQLSAGADLLLVMMVFLMIFVLYFIVTEFLSMSREGAPYLKRFWSYMQWAVIVLSACCVAVHLWRAKLADRQWLTYRAHPDGFPNFYHVASLSYLFTSLAALLLFLLTIKTARQVRFIRQWSIFGKTLNNSGKELRAMVVTFIFFLLAYTQLGYLSFSAGLENFKTFGSSMLSLLAVIHRGVSLRQSLIECPRTCYIYYISYMVIEIWVVLRLFAAVLIQNYRSLRLEMHRPAFEPQDYEMVDLFLRRLKIWIGMSKVKEFRHKVRFEGMVPLPSRSSRDSKSSCLHTASTVSDISMSSTSTISIPVDTFHLARPNEAAEIESNILRLVPIFESLLEQFDRVNQITEDIYQLECKLQDLQGRIRMRKRERKTEEPVTVYCQNQQPWGHKKVGVTKKPENDNIGLSLRTLRSIAKVNNTRGTEERWPFNSIPLGEDVAVKTQGTQGTKDPQRHAKVPEKQGPNTTMQDGTHTNTE